MKKTDNIQDRQIRQILSDTKISANDNLKFRIMQQIETETTLAKRNVKKNPLRIGSLLSTFGVIYGSILLLIGLIYFAYGLDTLTSTTVLATIASIAAVGSVLWMILVFDEKMRAKRNNKE